MSYVRASKEMPRLSDIEVEELARKYGLGDPNNELHMDKKISEDGERDVAAAGAQMG